MTDGLKEILPIYSQYNILLKAYKDSGLFIYLTEAFLYCRKNDYEIPEELLAVLEEHFLMFSEAKTKQDGLAALGFNSNEKGGAWQGKAALSKWEQSQIVSLCDDFILSNTISKKETFQRVSEICNTTYGHVKNLYYADKKRL